MRFTLDAVRHILAVEGIECAGIVPLSACRITKPYLLDRAGLPTAAGSVLIMALPYRAADEETGNLSAYAIPPDYHRVAADLFARLIPSFEAIFPGARFAGFADHAPIDERHAAAIAGLGLVGDNGLIITSQYGSYVFLAEMITDLPTDAQPGEIQPCAHCGACRTACPVGLDRTRCLSALTQKKGELTAEEAAQIIAGGSVWGCDICQSACPHNRHAACTPLSGFAADRIPHLTVAAAETMDDAEFSRRAYAWRGRAVILRNLHLFETNEPSQTVSEKKENLSCIKPSN